MPEKFIWRVGIALHCLPRILLFPPVILKHYKNPQFGRRYNSTTWWFGPLNLLSCISQVLENGALMTLTYISSTDNFGKIVLLLLSKLRLWQVRSLCKIFSFFICFSCPWRFFYWFYGLCYALHVSVLHFILVDGKQTNEHWGTLM